MTAQNSLPLYWLTIVPYSLLLLALIESVQLKPGARGRDKNTGYGM
jgi:hypothetical protein